MCSSAGERGRLLLLAPCDQTPSAPEFADRRVRAGEEAEVGQEVHVERDPVGVGIGESVALLELLPRRVRVERGDGERLHDHVGVTSAAGGAEVDLHRAHGGAELHVERELVHGVRRGAHRRAQRRGERAGRDAEVILIEEEDHGVALDRAGHRSRVRRAAHRSLEAGAAVDDGVHRLRAAELQLPAYVMACRDRLHIERRLHLDAHFDEIEVRDAADGHGGDVERRIFRRVAGGIGVGGERLPRQRAEAAADDRHAGELGMHFVIGEDDVAVAEERRLHAQRTRSVEGPGEDGAVVELFRVHGHRTGERAHEQRCEERLLLLQHRLDPIVLRRCRLARRGREDAAHARDLELRQRAPEERKGEARERVRPVAGRSFDRELRSEVRVEPRRRVGDGVAAVRLRRHHDGASAEIDRVVEGRVDAVRAQHDEAVAGERGQRDEERHDEQEREEGSEDHGTSYCDRGL
jgi:hypothetical protein